MKNASSIKNKSFKKQTYLPAAIIFVLAVSFVFGSCGNKEEKVVAPEGMNVLDLNRYGKPFAIFVPDTSVSKLIVNEQPSGALDIKVGKNFAVSIYEQAADLALRKTDLKEDEVNKLTGFIAEEPTALMWESAITDPEFHFVVNQKVGNGEYSFEDIRDPEAALLSKEAIKKMFESCKNIKEVHKDK